jgi:hypothetical protein
LTGFLDLSCAESDDGCSANDIRPSLEVLSGQCDKNGFFYLNCKDYDTTYTPTSNVDFDAIFGTSCEESYDDICQILSSSPPYSCTRTVYPSLFEVLGTGIANTQVIMAIMILATGSLMMKYWPLSDKEKTRLSQVHEDDYS